MPAKAGECETGAEQVPDVGVDEQPHRCAAGLHAAEIQCGEQDYEDAA